MLRAIDSPGLLAQVLVVRDNPEANQRYWQLKVGEEYRDIVMRGR